VSETEALFGVLRHSADAQSVAAIERTVREEVDAAALEALAMPEPDPASVLEGVYCEREPAPLGRGAAPWSGFAQP